MIHAFTEDGKFVKSFSSIDEYESTITDRKLYAYITDAPIDLFLKTYCFDATDGILKLKAVATAETEAYTNIYNVAASRSSSIDEINGNTEMKLTNGVYIKEISSYIEATSSNIEDLRLKAEYCDYTNKKFISVFNTCGNLVEINADTLRDVIKLLITYYVEVQLIKQNAIHKVKDSYNVEELKNIVSETV